MPVSRRAQTLFPLVPPATTPPSPSGWCPALYTLHTPTDKMAFIFSCVSFFFFFSSLPVPFVAVVRKTRRSRRRRGRRRAPSLKSPRLLHRNTKVNVWWVLRCCAQTKCISQRWLKSLIPTQLTLTDLNSFLHHLHLHASSFCPSASLCLRHLLFGWLQRSLLFLPISNHRFQMNQWPVRLLTGPQWLKSVLLCRASAISRAQKVTWADLRRFL